MESSTGTTIHTLLSYLDERNVRITPIRKRVLHVLLEHISPLRVEDVHARIEGEKPDVVTVYRTLELFVKIGLVHPVRFHEESARYELSSEVRDEHHHLVCTSCGRIQDVQVCLPESLTQGVERDTGSTITGHMLEFFGMCASCMSVGSVKKRA